MKEDGVSTLELCKVLGESRGRVRGWMDDGYIQPSYPSQGQGQKAVFTRADVYAVQLFRKLVDRGFNRKVASECALVYREIPRVVNYLYYRTRFENGERIIEYELFAGLGPFKTEIGLGNPETGYPCKITFGSSKPTLVEDWEDIYIVNIQKWFDEVEDALDASE